MAVLPRIARLPGAVWLSVAAMAIQTLLPLFIGITIVALEHGHQGHAALHRPHAEQIPSPEPRHGDDHPGGLHSGCILCLGLQAAGAFLLPTVAAPAPAVGTGSVEAVQQRGIERLGSPAAYASRAPPSI